MLWNDIHLRKKHLYEHLVQIVGTELDIRKTQRLFIIRDLIFRASGRCTQISSGSLAEGIDLPGSDMEVMYLINDTDVIRNIKKHQKQNTSC